LTLIVDVFYYSQSTSQITALYMSLNIVLLPENGYGRQSKHVAVLL